MDTFILYAYIFITYKKCLKTKGDNAIEKKSIIEKSVFRSKEERKGNCT